MTSDRVSDVCYVNEQGEIICGESKSAFDATSYDAVRAAIQGRWPGASPERVNLILRLIAEVMGSPLDDACIGTRSNDAVDSVHVILAEAPPVMLLYRYVGVPADIMATYYTQQTKFRKAFAALEHWKTLKPGC